MSLASPPAASNPDLDAAVKSMQDWARNHGYALVKSKQKKTQHKNKDMQEIRKLWMIVIRVGSQSFLKRLTGKLPAGRLIVRSKLQSLGDNYPPETGMLQLVIASIIILHPARLLHILHIESVLRKS